MSNQHISEKSDYRVAIYTNSPTSGSPNKSEPSYQIKPLPHPRLLQVLDELKPPSPQKVCKDPYQPKSGSLSPNKDQVNCTEPTYNFPYNVNSGSKKAVSLNLDSNPILQRRIQGKKNK